MADFELDVTQRSVGTFGLKTPDGRMEFDILPLTREPMLLFEKMRQVNVEEGDIDYAASAAIEGLSALLAPQNGGPHPREVFEKLWKDGNLSMLNMRELTDFLLAKAGGGDPPA